MNNQTDIGVIIFLFSLVLGFIKYGSISSAYQNANWQLKFIEIWNCVVNFLITGIIGYYFVLIRLPLLFNGGDLKTSDFILFAIVTLGLFGHLNVMSKNITDGIEVIFSKVLGR